jgi:hypothetical protein
MPIISPFGPVAVTTPLHVGLAFEVWEVERGGARFCVKTPSRAGGAGGFASRAMGIATSLWGGSTRPGVEDVTAHQGLGELLLALEAEAIRQSAGAWNHEVTALGAWDGPDDAWHLSYGPSAPPRWRMALVTPRHPGADFGALAPERQRRLLPRMLPALWEALTRAPHGDLSPANIVVSPDERRFVLIDPGVVLRSHSSRPGAAGGSMDDACFFTTNAECYPFLPPTYCAPQGAEAAPLEEHLALLAWAVHNSSGPVIGTDRPLRGEELAVVSALSGRPLFAGAPPSGPRPRVADLAALGVIYYRLLTGRHPLWLAAPGAPLWSGGFGERLDSPLPAYLARPDAARFAPPCELAAGLSRAESDLALALLGNRVLGPEHLRALVEDVLHS